MVIFEAAVDPIWTNMELVTLVRGPHQGSLRHGRLSLPLVT